MMQHVQHGWTSSNEYAKEDIEEERRALWTSAFLRAFENLPVSAAAGLADDALVEFDKRFSDDEGSNEK